MYQGVLGQRHPAVGHGVADQHALVRGVGLIRPVGEVENFTPGAYVLGDDHDTSATRLYHGQVVRLEWQSWHERSRIAPTCGLITSAMWVPVAPEVLGVVAVGTNCIPRKMKANRIEVSFASLRIRLR